MPECDPLCPEEDHEGSASTVDLGPPGPLGPQIPENFGNDIARQLVHVLREGLARSGPNDDSRWRPITTLPKFNGRLYEDPNEFINKTEDILEAGGLREEEYLEIVRDNLTGEARRWLEPLYHLRMSWVSFRRRFLERFDGTDARCKLNIALLSDQQGPDEPGRNFVARKMSLAQRLPFATTDAELVQVTIGLMRPDYRFALVQRNIQTMDKLLDLATILDEARPPRPDTQRVVKSNDQRTAYTPPPRQQAPPLRPSSPKRPENNSNKSPPGPCWTCGGNHWLRDCPERPGPSRPATNSTSTPSKKPEGSKN